MLRLWTVGLALVLASLAATPAFAAKKLKPKFGDVGGVFYTEIWEDREACRQAIRNKISICRQNTSFESNTKDRKYPGCLPIFEQQAEICVAHFRRQDGKCELQGSVRITDFTGFSCTATATAVEEGGKPEGAPGIVGADRRMRARTLANLRAGPGTNHPVVGALPAGREVQVTGAAGDWLRIAVPGGGAAFVHGSLLVAMAGREPTNRVGGSHKAKDRLDTEIAAALQRCRTSQSRWSAHMLAHMDEGYRTCGIGLVGSRKCRRRYFQSTVSLFENAMSACCTTIASSSRRHRKTIEKLRRDCRNYKRRKADCAGKYAGGVTCDGVY